LQPKGLQKNNFPQWFFEKILDLLLGDPDKLLQASTGKHGIWLHRPI
jgi:hypothetical protein